MTLALLASTAAVRGVGANPQPQASRFDFSISVAGNAAAYQGLDALDYATVTLVSGTSQPVTVACSDPLPQGVSCTFTPATANPTFISSMKIATSSSTPVGTYTIKVVGTGGGLTRSTHFDLTVNPPIPLGGSSVGIDKVGLLTPLLLVGLVVAFAGAGSVYLMRRRTNRKLGQPSLY